MEICYHRFNGITMLKLIFVSFFLIIFSASLMAVPVLAEPETVDVGGEGGGRPAGQSLKDAFDTAGGKPLDAVAVKGGGFDTSVTFETIVSTVITMVLGFMGAIFLVLAIYGGYNWMMARGNEDMVEKAKKTITNATIGLIVVLSAYAIVRIIVVVIGSKVFTKL